jgi:rhodanese-related sulfurtransferase
MSAALLLQPNPASILANAKPIEGLNYAGEVSPADAYAFMNEAFAAVVDVRTVPEWQFTGTPDTSATLGKTITLSWKTYPGFVLNPQFVDQLAKQEGITKDTPLFFLCRSGGRSLDAAIAMTAAGYSHCYNVTGGFEGEADANGHRGHIEGWKAATLPWRQG